MGGRKGERAKVADENGDSVLLLLGYLPTHPKWEPSAGSAAVLAEDVCRRGCTCCCRGRDTERVGSGNNGR